ncbi:MAG: hypothetical protein D4S01_04395 [Dehalococcoidia bacterium]|nr:MAG: hypothetical protein D4S01_04395 [Dehalococcoidia bacterium]
MVAGVWTYNACQLTYSETTEGPLELLAATPFPVATRTDTAVIAAEPDEYVFTTAPAGVQRATNFTLTIQLFDADGVAITTLSPDSTLTLNGGHASDVLNKTAIASGEWASGLWTSTTMQITGGTGSLADVTITITDDAGNIAYAVATLAIYLSDYTRTRAYESEFFGLDSYSSGITKWYASQQAAYTALIGSSLSWYNSSYPLLYGSANEEDWLPSYSGASDNASAEYRQQVLRYYFSAAERAAEMVSVGITVTVMGYGGDSGVEVIPYKNPLHQGLATLYYGYTAPTTYSDLLAGTPIDSRAMFGGGYHSDYGWRFYYADAPDISIPPSVISNMTGDYLYFWALPASYTMNGEAYTYEKGTFLTGHMGLNLGSIQVMV